MGMQKILKYPLMEGEQATKIKCKFVRLLDIQLQSDKTVAWILNDSKAPEATIMITPVGTGWRVPSGVLDGMEYVKTVQDKYGLVWHYYMNRT